MRHAHAPRALPARMPVTHLISPRPRRALAGSARDDPQHAAARPERSRAGQAQPLLDGNPTRAPQRGRRPVRQGQRLLPGLPRLRGRARVRRAPRQAHHAGTAILTMAAYQAHPARAPCAVTHAPTHLHPRIRATHSHRATPRPPSASHPSLCIQPAAPPSQVRVLLLQLELPPAPTQLAARDGRARGVHVMLKLSPLPNSSLDKARPCPATLA